MSAKKKKLEKKTPAAPATEVVKLDSLRPHPMNYRGHPEEQLRHLEESIRENGVYRNIVVARDGTILAGHGVWMAAKRVGRADIEVKRLDLDPDSARALKIVAADNEVSRLAQDDVALLGALLKRVSEEAPSGLLGTGHDDASLIALLGKDPLPAAPPSAFPEFDGQVSVKYKCPKCAFEWS